jgi:hypothetical protein
MSNGHFNLLSYLWLAFMAANQKTAGKLIESSLLSAPPGAQIAQFSGASFAEIILQNSAG